MPTTDLLQMLVIARACSPLELALHIGCFLKKLWYVIAVMT